MADLQELVEGIMRKAFELVGRHRDLGSSFVFHASALQRAHARYFVRLRTPFGIHPDDPDTNAIVMEK
jgi:hypothetical protein